MPFILILSLIIIFIYVLCTPERCMCISGGLIVEVTKMQI